MVELNYDRNRVRVYERYSWNGEGASLPLALSNGVPFVDLELRLSEQSNLTGSFLIDSAGGWMTIHLHRQVAEREKIMVAGGGVGETGLGLGGRTRRTVVRGEALEVGPHTFAGPPVAITDDAAGLRTQPSSAGLVGIEVLRKFNVVLDYRGQRLYLTPSREFSKRFMSDACSLRLQAPPPRFVPAVVSGVVPSSPASEAGFQVGDIIIEIDDRSVANKVLLGAEC